MRIIGRRQSNAALAFPIGESLLQRKLPAFDVAPLDESPGSSNNVSMICWPRLHRRCLSRFGVGGFEALNLRLVLGLYSRPGCNGRRIHGPLAEYSPAR